MKNIFKTFKTKDQEKLSDYLGIKIQRKEVGTLEWTQQTLIHSILKYLKLEGENFKSQAKIRTIPARSTVVQQTIKTHRTMIQMILTNTDM